MTTPGQPNDGAHTNIGNDLKACGALETESD